MRKGNSCCLRPAKYIAAKYMASVSRQRDLQCDLTAPVLLSSSAVFAPASDQQANTAPFTAGSTAIARDSKSALEIAKSSLWVRTSTKLHRIFE